MVFAGGGEGRERLREVEGIDLVKGQLAVLEGVEEFRVGTVAGAEWLHRQRVAIALSEVVEKQSSQHGFADTGVGAGDENNAGPWRSRSRLCEHWLSLESERGLSYTHEVHCASQSRYCLERFPRGRGNLGCQRASKGTEQAVASICLRPAWTRSLVPLPHRERLGEPRAALHPRGMFLAGQSPPASPCRLSCKGYCRLKKQPRETG